MQGAPTIAAVAQQQTCARRGGRLRGCFAACVGVRPPQEIGLTARVVQASDSIPDHGLDAMDTAWSGGRTCTETKHASVLDGGLECAQQLCARGSMGTMTEHGTQRTRAVHG